MSLLDEVDQLYEAAVSAPASVNDQMIADWAEGTASGYEIDRQGARYIRRSVNAARKLASFWSTREPAKSDPADWPSRVDLALGAKAWRPQLELAQHLLETSPSEDIYERAAQLFRLVNNEPFLDGMSYDVWFEAQQK